MPEETYIDGITRFFGGQDHSRGAKDIDKDQYLKGVNVIIPRYNDNIANRGGWQHIDFDFEDDFAEEIFRTKNIQGRGWYWDGGEVVQLRSVYGYIFEFRKKTQILYKAKILNRGDQNNPKKTKAWFTKVPGGSICNDAESAPFWISKVEFRRTNSAQQEIGPGREGVYVQNRFWYTDVNRRLIWGSDLLNPLSLQEAFSTNIFGFVPAEDDEEITAVGKQKFSNRDINGGELVFSTINNIYNVPVGGDRQVWGLAGSQGTGFVKSVLPGVGASSSFSFTSFNTNLFFRHRNLGVMDYKQAVTQFVRDDDVTSSSIEVNNWFDNDTEWMLDQVHSVKYKNRFLTTTNGSITPEGYVYWNGIISMNPSPLYGGKNKLPRRFEGLWTGVQPWGMMVIDREEESLFVDSYDEGVNRVYHYIDELQYDVNHEGRKVPIESVLETRGFSHDRPLQFKQSIFRYYSLEKVNRTTEINFYSKSDSQSCWKKFNTNTHYNDDCPVICKKGKNDISTVRPLPRIGVKLPSEKEEVCVVPFEKGGKYFKYRLYRMEFTGSYELSEFILIAQSQPLDKRIDCVEPDQPKRASYRIPDDFNYSIARR